MIGSACTLDSHLDLFEQYERELRTYVRRRLPAHRHHEVDDILQDIAIRLWRNRSQLIERPLNFAYRVAHHVLADFNAEHHRHCLTHSWTADDDIATACIDCAMEQFETQQQIVKLLSPLPAIQRDVLVAHKLYGYSCEEVSALLGLSPHTVKKYVTFAKYHVRHGKSLTEARA